MHSAGSTDVEKVEVGGAVGDNDTVRHSVPSLRIVSACVMLNVDRHTEQFLTDPVTTIEHSHCRSLLSQVASGVRKSQTLAHCGVNCRISRWPYAPKQWLKVVIDRRKTEVMGRYIGNCEGLERAEAGGALKEMVSHFLFALPYLFFALPFFYFYCFRNTIGAFSRAVVRTRVSALDLPPV